MRYILAIVFLVSSNMVLAKPMDFVLKGNGGNCNGCEWVAAEGDITSDTPKLLKNFIREYDYRLTFVFNSSGGSLLAGLELGEILRKYRANTSIGRTVKFPDGKYFDTTEGKCVSACAYAYLGGEERYSTKGLGFHQFYDKRILEGIDSAFTAKDRVLDQYLTGVIVDYLIRMGIDVSLYSFISSTPPKEVYFLSEIEMKKFGIDVDQNETTPWALAPNASLGGLFAHFSTLEAKPRTGGIFCAREPKINYKFMLIIPNDYFGDTTYNWIREAFSDSDDFYINKSMVNDYQHFLDKPSNSIFIVFSISKKSAIEIIESRKFIFDTKGGPSNAERSVFNSLSFFSINGDKNFPYSVLKSC